MVVLSIDASRFRMRSFLEIIGSLIRLLLSLLQLLLLLLLLFSMLNLKMMHDVLLRGCEIARFVVLVPSNGVMGMAVDEHGIVDVGLGFI